MTQLWTDQPITVELDAAARPRTFLWHAQRHTVAQIVQQWQVDVDWWSSRGRVQRDLTALITTRGLFCVIYYDHLTQTWGLLRVYD